MSTSQGIEFSQRWNQFYSTNQPKYMNEGIQEGFQEGFQEGMTTQESTQSQPQQLYQGQSQLKTLMERFDTLYDTYQDNVAKLATMDEEYNQILLRNNQVPSSIDMYLGKIVVDSHGNHYYITRFGHTRKFSVQSWESRDTTCSNGNQTTIPTITAGALQLLLPGPDMNAFEPCGKEGKIVRDGTNNIYKWVDIQGYGHRFPTAVNYSTSVTAQKCPNDYDVLPSDRFDAIAVGPDMNDDEGCSTVIVDQDKQSKLLEQKARVTSNLQELIALINQIESYDSELSKAFTQRRTELAVAVSNLQNEAQDEKNVQQNNKTLRAKWDSIVVQERMEYYQYLGLAGVGIVITGALLHQFFSRKE